MYHSRSYSIVQVSVKKFVAGDDIGNEFDLYHFFDSEDELFSDVDSSVLLKDTYRFIFKAVGDWPSNMSAWDYDVEMVGYDDTLSGADATQIMDAARQRFASLKSDVTVHNKDECTFLLVTTHSYSQDYDGEYDSEMSDMEIWDIDELITSARQMRVMKKEGKPQAETSDEDKHGYFVFRAFGKRCWRKCLPAVKYTSLDIAINAANELAQNYRYPDEAVFTVAAHRDDHELYRVSSKDKKEKPNEFINSHRVDRQL